MANKKPQGQTPAIPDEETRQILEELEAEGKADTPKPETPKAKEKSDATPTSKGKDTAKETPEPKDETPDEEEETPPEIKRQIKTIPYETFKKYKEKWRKRTDEATAKVREEYEGKIKELSTTPPSPERADDIKQLAEEYGLDEKLVSGLVDIAAKRAKPNIDIDPNILKQIKETQEQKAQDDMFEQEFKELSEEFPEAKENKNKLKDLAFDQRFYRTPLKDIFIYLRGVGEISAPKKSAEGSRGGSKIGAGKVEFKENMSEEEITAMSDEEFDEYSEWLSSQSKSKVFRKGKPIS